MPKITAAITTYKREWETINRALWSIRCQSYPPYEILLIDDNHPGTEYTSAIKEGLKEYPEVTYVSIGKNSGVAGARNLAIERAGGEFIAFLDDDDEWSWDKLETQAATLKEHPDAALIFTLGINYEDDTGKQSPVWQSGVFLEHPSYIDELKHDRVGSTSCPMICLDVVRELGGFPIQPAVEDYALWLKIIKNHPVYGVNESLFVRHMDSGEHISTNHKNTYTGYRMIFEEHRDAYKKDKSARRWIMYNIMREGIKAKQFNVIPYCFRWAWCAATGGK